MVLGECNCGAVSFKVNARLSDVFVCHCSICRRFSGSNGVAVAIVDHREFRWLQGGEEISTWKKPDADWQATFCRRCGSFLPGANDEHHTYIPVGLISVGGHDLRITDHIWVGSKAVWDEIGDAGKQHQHAFEAKQSQP